MLGLALQFFDALINKLFLDATAQKITDAMDQRNVRRG